MSFEIIPLSIPCVNWQAFLKSAAELLGYDPSKPIVESRAKLTPLAKVVIAYSAFGERPSQRASPTLRTAYQALSHVHFSFLLVGEPDFILKISNYASVDQMRSSVPGGVILTADMVTWKGLIEHTLKPSVDTELRAVFWELLMIFGKYGLSELWWDSTKQERTHLLENKK